MVVTAVAALALTLLFSSNAGAQEPDGAYVGNEVTTTTVAPQDESIVLAETDEAGPGAAADVKADKLAFTGSDSALLAGIGVVAVAVGGSVLLLRRRVAS